MGNKEIKQATSAEIKKCKNSKEFIKNPMIDAPKLFKMLSTDEAQYFGKQVRLSTVSNFLIDANYPRFQA